MRFKAATGKKNNVWLGGTPVTTEPIIVKNKTKVTNNIDREFNLCRVVPFSIVQNQDLFYHLDKPTNTDNFEEMLNSILTEYLQCS